MIQRQGHTIIVQGPVTIDNVVEITQQGIELFNGHDLVVDLAQVTEVDSAIVSMLLEWLRNARSNAHQIKFAHIPQSLRSLIQLYGITDLIPLSEQTIES